MHVKGIYARRKCDRIIKYNHLRYDELGREGGEGVLPCLQVLSRLHYPVPVMLTLWGKREIMKGWKVRERRERKREREGVDEIRSVKERK
jgi:hypothetical protein